MSDERLRELERRWRASASVDDEVALVNERLRVGAVTTPSSSRPVSAIRAELLPFALGHGDPVRARVEARRSL